MKITYAICTCTEHRELQSLIRFLFNVKDKEDDINILVDSQNGTEKVADVLEPYKNDIDIIFRNFDNDFGKHRNYQLERCKGDYIFIVDADEVPSYLLIKQLKHIIESSQGEIIYVPRINIIPDITQDLMSKWNFTPNEVGWINWPDFQGRICKNTPTIKYYDQKIHERLSGTDKVVQIQANPNHALWHIKSAYKQTLQDDFYSSISESTS